MHYELYVDSLFLINFIMNLYLLVLVDRSTLRTATPGRLAAGAAVGAAGFLLPLLLEGPGILKMALGVLIGTAGMLLTAFRVRSLRMFLKLLERLALYSFGIGGVILFLLRVFAPVREVLTGVFGILGVGGLAFLFYCRFRFGLKTKDSLCRAILYKDGEEVKTAALIDSGNSLVEPISGKPVCVVGHEISCRFWGDDDAFRAIPYHSIGKKRGIMPGYLLPKLCLEADGMRMEFRDVYVAVSDEEISGIESAEAESVKMIVNPGLFAEGVKGRLRKRQNGRQNDSESNDTGQDAVQNDTQRETAPEQKRRNPLYRRRRGAAAAAGAGTGESGHRRSGNRIRRRGEGNPDRT